ncbi:F-box protein interaction domain protein [Medicago truncatula]|uniref:F-box protein interaction domain protein n=1 Tax=Medicago truncatula TaxID=3880 RepID=G7KZ21_MEDTR|nr:F-box protein interaction domain protein [Medicago truncatula]
MNILPHPPPSAADPSAVVIFLPDDVIIEFLTFLEVKDLIRMKCVCKSWNTIISDPIFAKTHLKKKKRTKKPHLAFLSDKSEGSGDCRAVPISRLLQEMKKSSSNLTHDDLPYYYRFNYKNYSDIVGSCNGLVCLLGCSFTDSHYVEKSLSFWNPATRTKSDTLVSFRSYFKRPYREFCKFALGYDNSTDTFKGVLLTSITDGNLVAIGKTAARVFTLGGDNNNNNANAWRVIQYFPVVVVPHRFCYTQCDTVYLNNSINWLVCHRKKKKKKKKNLTIEQYVIVSLDLKTETYTQFLLPRSCNKELLTRPILSPTVDCLSVLMDCMCFSYDFKKSHFIIWKMDEFGVENSWTQFLKISYMNLQINYLPQLIPLCLSEDGDTIIFSINRANQAILYNWRDNRVKRIKSTNMITWSLAKAYVESLISTDLWKIFGVGISRRCLAGPRRIL